MHTLGVRGEQMRRLRGPLLPGGSSQVTFLESGNWLRRFVFESDTGEQPDMILAQLFVLFSTTAPRRA